MYENLLDFFKNTLFGNLLQGNLLTTITYQIGGINVTLLDYICMTLSLVMLITIFILCLMFIFKIIKIVGRLFTGA